jgi:hypothetical protein
LAAVAYISDMSAGFFRETSLLRRSKNKLQLLLEAQINLGLRIMYIIGVKRKSHFHPLYEGVKEFSYEPYVKLVRVSQAKDTWKSNIYKFI